MSRIRYECVMRSHNKRQFIKIFTFIFFLAQRARWESRIIKLLSRWAQDSRCFDVRLRLHSFPRLIVKTSQSFISTIQARSLLSTLIDWDIKEEFRFENRSRLIARVRRLRKGKRFLFQREEHQNVNCFDNAIWCLSVGCDAIDKKLQLYAENEAKCLWSFIETNGTAFNVDEEFCNLRRERKHVDTRKKREAKLHFATDLTISFESLHVEKWLISSYDPLATNVSSQEKNL